MSNIISQYYGDFQDMATQHMLAPIQFDLIAVKAYKVGQYFIFNNELYEVTAAIAQGATIVIGTGSGCNAKPSDGTVMEECKGKRQDIASAFTPDSNKVDQFAAFVINDTFVSVNFYVKANVTTSNIIGIADSKYYPSSLYHNRIFRGVAVSASGASRLVLANGTNTPPIIRFYNDTAVNTEFYCSLLYAID